MVGQPGREPQTNVAAVDRALTILEAFQAGDSELSLAELAARTKFHKSTILRLAGSLVNFAFLERTAGGAYRVGPGAWRLGQMFLSDLHLERHLRPLMVELSRVSEESVSFYVPIDGRQPARVCLLRQDSAHTVRDHVRVGDRLPLDSGAAGRLLRAYVAPRDGDAAVVAQGYFLSYGDRLPDLGAVAAPVFGPSNRIAGALTLSAPLGRRDRGWFEAQALTLMTCANAGSQALSGRWSR